MVWISRMRGCTAPMQQGWLERGLPPLHPAAPHARVTVHGRMALHATRMHGACHAPALPSRARACCRAQRGRCRQHRARLSHPGARWRATVGATVWHNCRLRGGRRFGPVGAPPWCPHPSICCTTVQATHQRASGAVARGVPRGISAERAQAGLPPRSAPRPEPPAGRLGAPEPHTLMSCTSHMCSGISSAPFGVRLDAA